MPNFVLADGSMAEAPDPAEQRVVWVIIIGLIVSTAFSTILHHIFPHVLDVPSNEGVPYMDYPSMFVLDMIPLSLGWLCFHHAWRRIGIYRAVLFLGGSFVFTGLEESMWILLGRYSQEIQMALDTTQGAVFGENADEVTGTYYFTRGFFWFIETPVSACVGWFFVAYSCMYITEVIMPRARVIWKATVAGLLAMNLDLWLDPVQTHDAFISWV